MVGSTGGKSSRLFEQAVFTEVKFSGTSYRSALRGREKAYVAGVWFFSGDPALLLRGVGVL